MPIAVKDVHAAISAHGLCLPGKDRVRHEFWSDFESLTGDRPVAWLYAIYRRLISDRVDNIPRTCSLPRTVGKASIIPLWLMALAVVPSRIPRRLVYVMRRGTVLDSATDVVVTMLNRLVNVPRIAEPLWGVWGQTATLRIGTPVTASTLRGRYADDHSWMMDPSRPAVLIGTVEQVASRLLFSDRRRSLVAGPWYAGLLGQDVLLIHEDAHLELVFKRVLRGLEVEKDRWRDLRAFHVMELTHRPQATRKSLASKYDQRSMPRVGMIPVHGVGHQHIRATQTEASVHLHAINSRAHLIDRFVGLSLSRRGSDRAILLHVDSVEDAEEIAARLRDANCNVAIVAGTQRGMEREELLAGPFIRRFVPAARHTPDVLKIDGSVYLICVGNVGLDISADQLICEVSTIEWLSERFARVSPLGDISDARIDVVHPLSFGMSAREARRGRALELLRQLDGHGSDMALFRLDSQARLDANRPVHSEQAMSEILLDALALTSVHQQIPNQPLVETCLEDIHERDGAVTNIAWREEALLISGELLDRHRPEDLLQFYPLQPHELLQDKSREIFAGLLKLKAPGSTPLWLIDARQAIAVTSLDDLRRCGNSREIENKTVILPPSAGGLKGGFFRPGASTARDIADESFDDCNPPIRRRHRVWNDAPVPHGMKLVRVIDFGTAPVGDAGKRIWRWYVRPPLVSAPLTAQDRDCLLVTHHINTEAVATRLVDSLRLGVDERRAVLLAARWHDLGKRRKLWQRTAGNRVSPNIPRYVGAPTRWGIQPVYCHELGSLLDVQAEPEFAKQNSTIQELVLHLIAAQSGRARPCFSDSEIFDPEHEETIVRQCAAAVPVRFARLQRKYGRWGLAYLESLLRAADLQASVPEEEEAAAW